MILTDTELHSRGEATFADDLALTEETLHAFPLQSSIAHGLIKSCDVTGALEFPGVKAVIQAEDIPGINNIGNVEACEVLLAENEVCYQGQPIAIIVATSAEEARRACELCKIAYEPLPAVFDARTADRLNLHIAPPRSFALGDVSDNWKYCETIVTGHTETGAQEHVYLETQTAIAYPQENEQLKIISATQSPGMVQRIISRVLGCTMHLVEVDVLRLGGGFGGKEEQATSWSVMAALAAQQLKQPVKIHLSREEDMCCTGKRHPYSADFKIGLSQSGKILCYEVNFYQNAGAVADLSLAVLERSLFHAGNAYCIPNVHLTAVSCRTNLPPNTAFRGFGAPQAMFVLEAAIDKAAKKLHRKRHEIQRLNLLQTGDLFPYGMLAKQCRLGDCWALMAEDLSNQQQRIDQFNSKHSLQKKALAMMPIAFGIAFTAKFLNQADALVHVYNDGSVSISSGAVEMGQGVQNKLRTVAARVFGISDTRIKTTSTNTSRIANMSPTAASTGADLNGQATCLACEQILLRLKRIISESTGSQIERIQIIDEQVYVEDKSISLSWKQLISKAYMARCGLSAQAHYATPRLNFDSEKEIGTPFAYHVYGSAAVEVTVDCLRGCYQIDQVNIVHDNGQSLAPEIDRGQIEGAVVQGLGWMTMEEIVFDNQGHLQTHNLTNYKIPDIYSVPEIKLHFLPDAENPVGLFSSKAVGEPPFMYGIAVYFALVKAIRSFNPEYEPDYSAPMTPEKVLLALYTKFRGENHARFHR